jgi:hypothetical protein
MVTPITVMLIGNTVMDTGMAVGIGVVTDTVMVAATGVVGGMAGAAPAGFAHLAAGSGLADKLIGRPRPSRPG